MQHPDQTTLDQDVAALKEWARFQLVDLWQAQRVLRVLEDYERMKRNEKALMEAIQVMGGSSLDVLLGPRAAAAVGAVQVPDLEVGAPVDPSEADAPDVAP